MVFIIMILHEGFLKQDGMELNSRKYCMRNKMEVRVKIF